MQIVTKYDHEILMPLFILYLFTTIWNPLIVELGCWFVQIRDFWICNFKRENYHGFFRVELSFYRWVCC
jgi:hypothetical protein